MIGTVLDTLGLRDPAQVRTAADLRAGKAVIFGRVTTERAIESPVHGKPCAAFYYRASFRRASRIKGFAQALLRDALVYADGLILTVEDVAIEVRPKANVDFGRPDHQALVSQKIDGFRASEKRVPSGATVAAHGRLRREKGRWVLSLEQLDYEPPAKKQGGGKGAKKGARRRR